MNPIFVTGAAGFIGSALCRYLCLDQGRAVIGIDKMTYAASRESLAALDGNPLFELIQADINDVVTMDALFAKYAPAGIMHLAAETHVDRSIDDASAFIDTNIHGTFVLLEAARHYMAKTDQATRAAFRFLHVSTDEVYGALGPDDAAFTEETPYAPNSPYAASKAAADHLARAWARTYDMPVVISNCSNNYGPYQFPEKLIPLCIAKALAGEPLPLYGRGENVRDWLFVDDHARALYLVFQKGQIGEKYNIGGAAECRNIDLLKMLCGLLDEMAPADLPRPFADLITFVTDRPGHDERYAMNFDKLTAAYGWRPSVTLDQGLRATVAWYLQNQAWIETIRARKYAMSRLGTIKEP